MFIIVHFFFVLITIFGPHRLFATFLIIVVCIFVQNAALLIVLILKIQTKYTSILLTNNGVRNGNELRY